MVNCAIEGTGVGDSERILTISFGRFGELLARRNGVKERVLRMDVEVDEVCSQFRGVGHSVLSIAKIAGIVITMKQWVIGVDEAGRGPLAGPVAVGVALVPADFDWELIPGVGDSKKIAAKKREAIFRRAEELKKLGKLDFAVVMVSAAVIDKKGIVSAIATAMDRALKKIKYPPRTILGKILVKLDGGLKAPLEYSYQETIIKGDAKEKVIGLASIMAKVTHDRYMERIATKPQYTPYDFAKHKGYGTKVHRTAIVKNGFSLEHRQTYCKNIKML